MHTLPTKYQWLKKEQGPRIFAEMFKLYGTIEAAGDANNPLILSWAREIGYGHVYRNDEVAWCGLAMAYAAARAGWNYAPRGNPLWARNWLEWGKRADAPMFGDVLVFTRQGGGGHVGLYIAEDAECYHVLGGNQEDAVNIMRIPKLRLLGARRCRWRVNQPANIRKIRMASGGKVSVNEA